MILRLGLPRHAQLAPVGLPRPVHHVMSYSVHLQSFRAWIASATRSLCGSRSFSGGGGGASEGGSGAGEGDGDSSGSGRLALSTGCSVGRARAVECVGENVGRCARTVLFEGAGASWPRPRACRGAASGREISSISTRMRVESAD